MADHFGFAGHHRSAMQPSDVAEQQDENGTAGGGRGADGPPRKLELRRLAVDEEDGAKQEGDQPADAQHPEGWRHRLRSHQRDAQQHEAEPGIVRSEEHTSELQSLMRISYAVFCLKKKT